MNNFRSLIIFVLIILISIVSISSLAMAKNIDQVIREKVQSSETKFMDRTMHGVTYLGDGGVDLIIASAIPDKEARNDSYKSLLVGGVSVFALKSIIGKQRPYASDGTAAYHHFTLDSTYHSMPSGHTTSAFALATSIANHYPKYKYLSYGLATLVGISRLYEDVHWASDVVAGAGLGYLSAKFVELKW